MKWVRAVGDRWVAWMLTRSKQISVVGRLRVKGRPLVEVHPMARVEIGEGVLLHSRNRGYHLNMHNPVKLLADWPGACIRIGAGTRINGSCIHACRQVEIGRGCLIAANTQIMDNNGHNLSFPDVENRIYTKGTPRPVAIEDYVWLGVNTVVLPGVRIGRGAVVAANSVVSRDLPPMCIAGGNPAVVYKTYEASDANPQKEKA